VFCLTGENGADFHFLQRGFFDDFADIFGQLLASTDDEFTASDIKTFRANFRPNGKLSPDVLRQKVQFEKTVSVKAQKALEAAINAGTLTLNSDGELVSGDGNEGNNGVSGD
jgi:hypothetical protein